MDYNWNKIKSKINLYCTSAFSENSIIVTQSEINELIDIFYNFVFLSLPHQEINGLGNEMLRGLQCACVDDIGNQLYLKSIASLEDAFMKKLILLCGIDSFSNISCLTQMALYKKIGLWGNSIPDFYSTDVDTFRGDVNGMFFLGVTYLTRNVVHNAPNWDDSEVTRRLKYVLAFYVFLIYRFKSQLLSREPSLSEKGVNYFEENQENALLYDYLSYGNTSVEINKRYVRTYVEHQLYRSNEVEEQVLIRNMRDFSDKSLSDAASKRILVELVKEGLIRVVSHSPKAYALTEDESSRIKDAKDNYNIALQSYNMSMEDILARYSIHSSVDVVSCLIMDHLSALYNYDINEALGEVNREEKSDYHTLVARFEQLGCPSTKGKELYQELLRLNRENDVLVRVSAGRVFRRISNPDQFNEYFRMADRIVWIDTQILLYLICYNEDYSQYNHPLYKTALALFKHSSRGCRFHYKVASFYINELSFQLKQALLLISVVDMPFAKKTNMSRNVFYQHYRQLYENEGLPEGVESFGDYMLDNFNLYADDAFALDFNSISRGIIEGKLDEFGISIEMVPQQDINDINNSESIFISVTSAPYGSTPKQGKPLTNDAWMGVSLFKHTESQKPIFITLDSSFEPYRKQFLQKYRRGQTFNWHLFSPSAFVNHMDFIDFKINAENLTDDLISIVETDDVKDKTLSVIDRINRFLDIPHISSGKRKKYVSWVEELFQSEEYSYQPDSNQLEEVSPSIIRFLDAQDTVFSYFYDQKGEGIKQFQKMLNNEEYFKAYIHYLKDYASDIDSNKDDLILKVELDVEEFSKSDLTKSE